jgi:hypothetical protein
MKTKLKKTNDEYLSEIKIKSIEKDCLDKVFEQLCILEQEASSDDDSIEKKYLKLINEKANNKKMKLNLSPNKKSPVRMIKKNYEEDQPQENQLNSFYSKKFGVKALRKILRVLTSENMKEEIKQMIWENDENLDKYICYSEFEKMYKRCILDQREEEPKKLYYLTQFLMYDKEKKGHIIEEDTLEILYIRYQQKFEDAINDIFM